MSDYPRLIFDQWLVANDIQYVTIKVLSTTLLATECHCPHLIRRDWSLCYEVLGFDKEMIE